MMTNALQYLRGENMINSLVQFRVDEKLKKDAIKVYENLGLDLSTAVKLFFKKTVAMNKMPFSINNDTIVESDLANERLLALKELENMNFSFSNDFDEKEELYKALGEKYENIN